MNTEKKHLQFIPDEIPLFYGGVPLPPPPGESSWSMSDIELPSYEEYVANGGEPLEPSHEH